MPSVLFVCLGNICRSPTAEAVFRQKASQAGIDVRVDSAGTSAAHQGERPDPRSMVAGQSRGYIFDGQSSRQVTAADFMIFDYILAMDSQNLRNLERIKPRNAQSELRLFLDYDTRQAGRDVPDPYYGGIGGFDHVLDLIEAASDGLLHHMNVKGEIG